MFTSLVFTRHCKYKQSVYLAPFPHVYIFVRAFVKTGSFCPVFIQKQSSADKTLEHLGNALMLRLVIERGTRIREWGTREWGNVRIF